jgi:phage-related minor tail protein
VAYTAEIQIAIKGAKELQRLQDRIKETSKLINKVNTDIEAVAGGGVVRSINNLSKTVADAAAAFNEVALETGEAALAAKAFVDANKNLNRGLQERITLLNNVAQEERRLAEEQRKRSLRAAGIVERTQYAGPIGPGEASSVALSSPLRGRVQQIIDERNGVKQLEQALLSLEMRRVKETNAILDEKAAQVALNLERKKEAGFFNSPGMRPQAQKSKGPSFRKQLSNPSSKLGSAVIGGGFPALMGGGPGTIAGGAIGGLLGGFAGSIGGSAIGQFLDTAIQKVQELGNAINTLNFDKVVESGVRLTGELRTQLDLLVKVGQAQQAQERLSQEVASVTGTPAGTTEDISNAVNLLNAAFNSVVSTVSTLLGIIGAPFVAALAAALGLVSLIAKGLNVVLGFVGKLIKDAGKFVVNLIGGEDAVRNLERSLAGVNGQFDEAIAKANQLRVELNQAVVTAAQNLGFERRMTPGSTAGEKLTNNDVELEKKLAGLTVDRLNANIKIREDNAQAELAVPGTIAGLVKQNNLAFDLLEKTEKLVAARRAESIQIQENARLAREAAQAAEKAQRQAEARTNSLLQIEKGLYNVDLQRIALNVQQIGIVSGTEASLQRQLDLAESKRNISIAMLRVEQDSALAEAAKLGTTAQVNVLYAAKLKLLNLQLSTEEEITEQTKRQLQLDKFIAAQTAVDTAVKPIQDFLADQEQELRLAKIYSRLLMEGVLPAEAQRQVNFEKIVSAQLRSLDIQIATTKATIAQAEYYGLSAAKVKELTEALINLEKARSGVTASAATGPGVGPTDRERLQTEADRVRGELNTLTDPINMITTAAAGIGDAFSTSFKGIISGSMTAKEALASFFTSVADMFLDMAAQIIAKMITMAILNAVLGVLPGGAFSGGTSSAVPTDAAGWAGSFNTELPGITSIGKIGFAKGGAFSNSIVSSPTLFKFADGGSMRTGLMGEAGPEAIMPLTRGPGGKLGVMASGGGGDVNVVVNVDAKGSSVEGDAGQAKALGNAISAAVQSELIKQKRPGGLLA